MSNAPESKKIERRCPRCRTHAYHWLTTTCRNHSGRTFSGYHHHAAGCVNCGHAWKVRVMERDK